MEAVKFLRVVKLGAKALGATVEEYWEDLAMRLEIEREGFEDFRALVTRPAAPEVALAERDASILIDYVVVR